MSTTRHAYDYVTRLSLYYRPLACLDRSDKSQETQDGRPIEGVTDVLYSTIFTRLT